MSDFTTQCQQVTCIGGIDDDAAGQRLRIFGGDVGKFSGLQCDGSDAVGAWGTVGEDNVGLLPDSDVLKIGCPDLRQGGWIGNQHGAAAGGSGNSRRHSRRAGVEHNHVEMAVRGGRSGRRGLGKGGAVEQQK